FRQYPHTATGRDPHVFRDRPVGQFGGDVQARVAHADHDHAFTAHIDGREGAAVLVAVQCRAVEASRVLRNTWVPVVDVGDDQCVVMPDFAGVECDLPTSVDCSCRPPHRGVEGDRVAESEMVDVVAEVLVYEGMVGEVWPVPLCGEVLELQPRRGGVDMQRFVAG